MGYPSFAGRYTAMQVNTADRFELLLLLYKGAITELKQAVACFDAGNIEGRVRHINRGCAIITELKASLSFEDGGEIARSLDRLYIFMTQQTTAANIRQDPQPVNEVIRLLEILLSAWEEVYEKQGVSGRTSQTKDAKPDRLTLHQPGTSSIAVSL